MTQTATPTSPSSHNPSSSSSSTHDLSNLHDELCVSDLTVATIGNVDSGKSTLVGVLTKSILDDGRGYARSKIFNFSHEVENGRTSSIAHEIMGFHTYSDAEKNKKLEKIEEGNSPNNNKGSGSNTSGSGTSEPSSPNKNDENSNSKSESAESNAETSTRESAAEKTAESATVVDKGPVQVITAGKTKSEMLASAGGGSSSSTASATSGSSQTTGIDKSFEVVSVIDETRMEKGSKNKNKDKSASTDSHDHHPEHSHGGQGSSLIKKSGALTSAQKTTLWTNIQKSADRIIQFVDLCGHEKYLKTTIFGLVGLCPDYCLVLVNSLNGLQRMSREHIGISVSLRIPIVVVLTKIDLAPKTVYDENLLNLCKVLKSTAVRRLPVLVKKEEDVIHAAQSILSERIVPVFSVSSVTGEGLDYLRSFLYNLKPRAKELLCRPPSDPLMEFHVESVFQVSGVGTVVAGFVRSGTVVVGNHLYLGPDSLGRYKHLIVRGIHIRRVPKQKAVSGDHCSFSLRSIDSKEKLKKNHFRKGMVLLSDINLCPTAFRVFEAEIIILHHSTTILPGYQAVIHSGVIRQSAEVLSMSSDLLRTGDRALVRFRFLYHVEFLRVGWTLLFREGRTKGIGKIVRAIPYNASEEAALMSSNKVSKKGAPICTIGNEIKAQRNNASTLTGSSGTTSGAGNIPLVSSKTSNILSSLAAPPTMPSGTEPIVHPAAAPVAVAPVTASSSATTGTK